MKQPSSTSCYYGYCRSTVRNNWQVFESRESAQPMGGRLRETETWLSIEQAHASLAPVYKQIIEMEAQAPEFSRILQDVRQRLLTSRMEVFNRSTGRSGLRGRFAKPLYPCLSL